MQVTAQPEACACSPMGLQAAVGCWTASSQAGDPEVNFLVIALFV